MNTWIIDFNLEHDNSQMNFLTYQNMSNQLSHLDADMDGSSISDEKLINI